MIRVLRVARRGAMKARIQAGAQLDALIVTAPEQVRAPLRKLTSKQRIRACAALRPGAVADPASAVKTALRALARRWQALQAEIDDLDAQLTPLVTSVAPDLLALPGVGVETAGQLLVTAGDNPGRLRSTHRSLGSAALRPSRCRPGGLTGTGYSRSLKTARNTALAGTLPRS
jgi:transposase